MSEKKETWEKPELIIINRSYEEENVLAFCNEPATNPTCTADSFGGTSS